MTFYTRERAPRPPSGRKLRRIERKWQRTVVTGNAHRVRILDPRVTVYRVRCVPWPPNRWRRWQGEPRDETVTLWTHAVRGFTRAGCERRAVREYERKVSR